MAYYNKIGLLILSEDKKKLLVCEPGSSYKEKRVQQYIMPGGQLEEKSDKECLQREIKEELDTEIEEKSIELIDEYTDVSAAGPDRDVMIRLYKGDLVGTPKPSSEIGGLHWVGKEDINNPKVSPIIKNKIIPDLIKRKILN